MKKAFTLFLVLVLIFSVCACNPAQLPNDDNRQDQSEDNQPSHTEDNQPSQTEDNQQTPNDNPVDAEYKLTVVDYWGYLIKPLDEYYKAGEEVEVTLAFLSGPSVGIELNGKYIGENADTRYDGAYPVITFIMPARDSILYTTQNGYIGFKSTFSRAGSGGDPDIRNNALNAGKLNDSNPCNLPLYKFDTLSDLEKFKSDFGGKNGFNYGWDEVPSLNEATKYYDEDFFERYTLVLVYVEASSGSYRFGFKNVTIQDNYLCIHVEQTNDPDVFTDDEASWFVTVVVPDDIMAKITELDADLLPYSAPLLVPDDFSFALTWGVYGISSYDSETGKMVKTSDTTNSEDYTTYCQLSDEDMEYIYNLIVALDVYSYPEEYDPQAGFSQPWRTLILTVRVDDEEHTIKAEYVSDMMFSEDEKGQLFLDTCEAISNRLELTRAWMGLPNYPTRYQ